MAYPTLGPPERVDWVDYEERNEAADPDAIAQEVLARAGDQTIWLAWAGTYRTFEGQCEALNTALLQARPGGHRWSRTTATSTSSTPGCSRSRLRVTATRLRRSVGEDIRAALPAWIAARVLVAIGYAIARLWSEFDDPERLTIQLHQGLFAWDGAFYREIASHGYDALPDQALRFFPLYPLSGRGLGFLLGGNEGIALLLIANVAALAAAALLHRLVLVDLGDRGTARLSASLLALAPPAFVLVWAYAEALFLVCAIGAFLALRKRSWWWARWPATSRG